MNDTIESLRAKLAEVERERDALIADFSRELDEARKQITDSVMDWARKSGCVYCGEVFDTIGPEGECEARRALYADHTKVCAKHPMREVERERDHALAACAEMRAALENLVATIQRNGLQPDPPDPNAAVRVNHKIRRDWACRGCRPDSDVLKDGFLCAYHRVQALLARTDLGRGMVVVEREVLERWRERLSTVLCCLHSTDHQAREMIVDARADLDALLDGGKVGL